MNFIKNLSIGRKITSLIILMIFLEGLIASFSIFYLNQLNSNLNKIVEIKVANLMLEDELTNYIAEFHRAEKNILLSDNKEEFDKYYSNLTELETKTEALAEKLKVSLDKQNIDYVIRFQSGFNKFVKINSSVVDLAKNNLEKSTATNNVVFSLAQDAIALSKNEGRAAYDSMNVAMTDLSNKIKEELEVEKISTNNHTKTALDIISIIAFISLVIGLLIGYIISKSISTNLNKLLNVANEIALGNLETSIEINSTDETGKLAESISLMQTALQKSENETANQNWLKTGIARLNDVMRGEMDLTDLSNKVLSEISNYLDAKISAFYILENNVQEPVLTLLSSFAYQKRKNLSNKFMLGEGLVGQAALEKQQLVIKNVPEDYIKVTSGLGESLPHFIVVTPFIHENHVNGVIEIGTLNQMEELDLEYLKQAMTSIAINVESAKNRKELQRTLDKTKLLAEELQRQQEELKASNEELEEQTQRLMQSEEKLKYQQQELIAANEELEEQTEQLKLSEEKLKAQQEELSTSNEELEETNQSLQLQKQKIEEAKKEVEIKAEEVAKATKYKSEFLGNMSHELRTPLNSLLILSKILADNTDKNLTPEQVESAQVIHSSGNDLLSLINEILDLAKIEAGHMDVNVEKIVIKDLANSISTNFTHVANKKGLDFSINIDKIVPEYFESDIKRVEQVIKNLLSNAFKFTKKGSVTIEFGLPAKEVNLFRSGLDKAKSIAISVKDTGIGVSPEGQKVIFEAFQQENGGTTREYGGTGLACRYHMTFEFSR